jgi:outer membrane protein
MKNLNTILIAVLILAVGVLYFLHFSQGGKPASASKEAIVTNPSAAANGLIAYVDLDTLLAQMEMYKDLQENLAKKQKDLEGSFGTKYKAFQNNVNDLQNKVNRGLVTRAEAEQMNKQLANDQAQLEELNNTYTQQIQEEGFVSNRKVVDYIMAYLKDYTKDKNIKFVFSYAFGGNLLYTDSAYDITADVLKGVNEKYLSEKAANKK